MILSGATRGGVVAIGPGAKVALTGLTVTSGRATQGAGVYLSPARR